MKKSGKVLVFNKHAIGNMARVERFPQPGETVQALEWKFGEDAGKGSNVAVALGLQHINASFICKVGDDHEGELGLDWLKNADVDYSHYYMCENIHTDVGLVVTRTDGENMVIGSPAHNCFITYEEVVAAIDDYDDAEYFVSGLEIDQTIPLRATKYAKEHGLITAFNPSPIIKTIEEKLEYIDYLFVNEVEAGQLTGMDPESSDWEDMARRVKDQYESGTVIMTLGGNGCVVCDSEGTRAYPSYDVKAIDTVAAGDAFMAAFIAALTWGYSNAEAADWANRYGAVTVSRKGAILSYPTLEEVKEISREYKKRVKK